MTSATIWHWNVSIIPYQELLGNYDKYWPMLEPSSIIPYQELLGNYDVFRCCKGVIFDYTIPRAIREL